MSDHPPVPPQKDFEARLRQAQAKQAKRTGPEGGTGRPSAASGLGFAFRIGTELVVGIVVGVGIGLGLDYWLGTKPWLMIAFFFLGAGAGMLNVYRTVTGIGHGVGYKKTDQAEAEASDAKR